MNAHPSGPGRLARQQARRRQRERFAGITVVLLGAAVLVIAVLALRSPQSHVASEPPTASTSSGSPGTRPASSSGTSGARSSSHTASSSASPSTSTSAPAGDVKSVPLVVLNNTETSGLARRAAQRFEDGGWTVSDTGNLTNNIISTCAYYDPDVAGARAAADALQDQFPTIKRVKARFAELPSAPIVVVLTPGYADD